jgi:hypothetical protein
LAQGRPGAASSASGPNIVLEGLDAHDEDRLDMLRIEADDGEVAVRRSSPALVLPHSQHRPDTAHIDPAVTDTLQSYRRDGRPLAAPLPFA